MESTARFGKIETIKKKPINNTKYFFQYKYLYAIKDFFLISFSKTKSTVFMRMDEIDKDEQSMILELHSGFQSYSVPYCQIEYFSPAVGSTVSGLKWPNRGIH